MKRPGSPPPSDLCSVFSSWFTAEESWREQSGHVIGPIYRAHDLIGELRTTFPEEDSTDAAQWFTLEEVRTLSRVDLVDFVLDLL